MRLRFDAIATALLSVLTCINLYLFLFRTPAPRSPRLEVGTRFPAFKPKTALNQAVGNPRPGKRITYYSFSPTCHWCETNMPNMLTLAAALRPQERFVGLTQDSDRLSEYLAEKKFSFPILVLSPGEQLAPRLGGTPTTIAVNEKGVIERLWRGAYGGTEKLGVEQFFQIVLPLDVRRPHLVRKADPATSGGGS
jgi:hypothetical protein